MKRWALVTSGWVLMAAAVVTLFYQLANFLLSPPVYAASARVGFAATESGQKAERVLAASQPDFLLSTNVLYPACDSLGLAEKWSRRYLADNSVLTQKGVFALLRGRIRVSHSRNENEPVQVTVYSEKPGEAIEIANAIAASLKNQLALLDGTANSDHDVWIQKATEERRLSSWFSLSAKTLVKTLMVVVPGGILSVILIWLGRQLPPPLPMPPKPEVTIFSKY